MKSRERFSDSSIIEEIKRIENLPETKKRLDDVKRDLQDRVSKPYILGFILLAAGLFIYYLFEIYGLIVCFFLYKYWYQYSQTNKSYIGNTYANNFLEPVLKEILPGTEIDYFGTMDLYILKNLVRISEFYESNCHIIFGDEYKTEFCNLKANHYRRDKKGREINETDFMGQVFFAPIKTGINGHIRVAPISKGGSHRPYGEIRDGEERMETESIEFNDLYTIFSTDDLNAKFLLDTKIIELLNDIGKRMNVSIYMNEEYVSIAFQSNSLLFSLPYTPGGVNEISLSGEYEKIRKKLSDFYALMDVIVEKF